MTPPSIRMLHLTLNWYEHKICHNFRWCARVDNLNRNFLWDADSKHKKHNVIEIIELFVSVVVIDGASTGNYIFSIIFFFAKKTQNSFDFRPVQRHLGFILTRKKSKKLKCVNYTVDCITWYYRLITIDDFIWNMLN